MSNPQFKLGDKVRLKTSPTKEGRVVEEPRLYSGGYEYLVTIRGEESWYSESILVLAEKTPLPVWQKRDVFLRNILLAKLSYAFTDSLYSYRASRTEFAAYQFRPALKFLRSVEQRILIADEVGLGKTIEACIIYLELKARLNISQVMIVCPSRLKQKWQDELTNRFEEDFRDLDSNSLRKLFGDYKRTSGTIPFRAIVSFETLRSSEILEELMSIQMKLDLLIIDEAHHMRNQDTSTHRVGSVLTDNADAAVFLTATPLHLGNDDLYNLLYLLSPGDFHDRNLFGDIVEPNGFINEAIRLLAAGRQKDALYQLRQIEKSRISGRFLNNPYYESIVERLKDEISSLEDRIYLQRDLIELNTLSNIITRTRKREVAHAAVRAAYSINVTLTPEEEAFYDAVLENVREELVSKGYGALSFATIMKERMAASCLIAMRETIEESPNHQGISLYAERSIYDVGDDNGADDTRQRSKGNLLTLSRQIGKNDSKLTKFLEIVEGILSENKESKILVFSSFRKTLAYLSKQLDNKGYPVSLIHGDVKMTERQRVIDNFRTSPLNRIMLSSEVGAEGLDFQFCDVLVNYDLPWNPMQVEQRIGRLDRFGQLHERIRIYNFFIENTIETRILQRLYNRINIFRESIGDLEAILGQEIRELTREVLQAKLTPREEENRAEMAANRIAELQRAEEELDSKRDELLGQDAILNQQVENTVSSGRVIHPQEVCAAVQSFISDLFPQVEFTQDEEEPTWTLTLTNTLAAYLRQHQTSRKKINMLLSERFQQAMVQNKQIALTFDSEFARQRPLLEFITYNHVLADAAIQHWKEQQTEGIPCLREIAIEGPISEVGEGFFYVYALNEEGIQERRTLNTIIVLDDNRIATESSKNILGQIPHNPPVLDLERNEERLVDAQRLADTWVAERRDYKQKENAKRNDAIIAARIAAIEQSFRAKIVRAEITLRKVSEKRIRTLYEGQIKNLEAQLEVKVKELRSTPENHVSSKLVALGRVRIIEKRVVSSAIIEPLIAIDKQQPTFDYEVSKKHLITVTPDEAEQLDVAISIKPNNTKQTSWLGKLQGLFSRSKAKNGD